MVNISTAMCGADTSKSASQMVRAITRFWEQVLCRGGLRRVSVCQ